MVCQAAGKTRFRELKHENGVVGFDTIIVRVIACFQPLGNCQLNGLCLGFTFVSLPIRAMVQWQEQDVNLPSRATVRWQEQGALALCCVSSGILSSFAQASYVDKIIVQCFGVLVQLGFLVFTTSWIILQAITKPGSLIALLVLFGLMGKDFESWVHQRQPDAQFPDAKSLKLPFDLGMQNSGIPCAIPCTNAAPMSGALPSFGFTGSPNFKVGHSKEPHGWFYCLPRYRQGLVPDTAIHNKFMPEIDFLGKASVAANENLGEANVSPTDAQCAPKQFLVFDQTGNKTTLILSSMIGASNQPLKSWSKKPTGYYNINEGEIGNGSNGQFHSGTDFGLSDDLDDDNAVSEMHEDTEDIDALLSSDDEDNSSENGEETSTGCSPSTMTAYKKQDWFYENDDEDEVASSACPKRQKLSYSSYEVPSVTYTSSPLKPKGSLEYEDDAESSSAGGQLVRPCDPLYSLSGSKRDRKEKIRETVSILQTILPVGDCKDAVVVLDEAINYLKTLKFKALSLGISGL